MGKTLSTLTYHKKVGGWTETLPRSCALQMMSAQHLLCIAFLHRLFVLLRHTQQKTPLLPGRLTTSRSSSSHTASFCTTLFSSRRYPLTQKSSAFSSRYSCYSNFENMCLFVSQAIINSLAVNDDGVLVSGADNGSIWFWDYKSGNVFQEQETIAQPGSLDSEQGNCVVRAC